MAQTSFPCPDTTPTTPLAALPPSPRSRPEFLAAIMEMTRHDATKAVLHPLDQLITHYARHVDGKRDKRQKIRGSNGQLVECNARDMSFFLGRAGGCKDGYTGISQSTPLSSSTPRRRDGSAEVWDVHRRLGSAMVYLP